MYRKKRTFGRLLPGSFTIEAALLVPLVLAVVFLILQIILYLHDTVLAEAWLYQETWKLRWNQEQEENVFPEEEAPNMAVLRYEGEDTAMRWNDIRRKVRFRVELLPQFASVVFDRQPTQTEKGSTEKKMQFSQFLRIAGAILEEWEE